MSRFSRYCLHEFVGYWTATLRHRRGRFRLCWQAVKMRLPSMNEITMYLASNDLVTKIQHGGVIRRGETSQQPLAIRKQWKMPDSSRMGDDGLQSSRSARSRRTVIFSGQTITSILNEEFQAWLKLSPLTQSSSLNKSSRISSTKSCKLG